MYKWKVWGLQPNYYYDTADAQQLPVELDQIPNNFQTFRNFSAAPPDPGIFALPPDCDRKCPFTSLCTALTAAGGSSML